MQPRAHTDNIKLFHQRIDTQMHLQDCCISSLLKYLFFNLKECKSMENCTQCKKIKSRNSKWKNYIARYHDVEIRHSVCPQCSELSFPKLYKAKESQAIIKPNPVPFSI